MDPFDFSGVFGAGLPSSPLVDPSTINFNLPAMFADRFAAAGIGPSQFMSDPASAGSALSGGRSPSLGESLDISAKGNTPLPTPDPRKAVPGGDAADATDRPSLGDRLAKGLTGVKAPAAPTPQKVGTPSASTPQVHGTIKSGELAALLNALGSAPGGLKLPSTLGAALSKGYRGY